MMYGISEATSIIQVETIFKICGFFIFKGRKNKSSKKYRRYIRMYLKIRNTSDIEKAKQLAYTFILSLR